MYLMLALLALTANPDMDYSSAYAAAQKDKGMLLVLASTTWCGPCQAIKQDPEILPALRKRGYFAILDPDKDQATAKKLEVQSVPVLIVYRYDQKLGWRVRRFLGLDPIRAYAVPPKQAANVPVPTR